MGSFQPILGPHNKLLRSANAAALQATKTRSNIHNNEVVMSPYSKGSLPSRPPVLDARRADYRMSAFNPLRTLCVCSMVRKRGRSIDRNCGSIARTRPGHSGHRARILPPGFRDAA